jgi:Protein of unknown function (DUF2442)
MKQDKFEKRFAKAIRAAKESDAIQPRAEKAFYDAKNNRIVVELKSGCVFMFPPKLTQVLSEANTEQLESVTVTPSGEGLYFEKLDEDFSLPKLMIGVFGNKKWMSQIKTNATPKIKKLTNGRSKRQPHKQVA